MRNVLLRGVTAGAAAGLLTSLFHLLLTEPVLERAVALEGAGAGPVSREAQKYLGGPAGQVLFGISIGVLFALLWRILPPGGTPWRRAVGLAFASWLVVALLPQLRYPANPPGVGDPDTIGTRTSSYLLAYVLGIVVVGGGWATLRRLRQRGWSEPARQLSVTTAALAVVTVGYALLPDSGDAVTAPASLVWDFRLRALGGLTLLFAALGAVFGSLSLRAERQRRMEAADARMLR